MTDTVVIAKKDRAIIRASIDKFIEKIQTLIGNIDVEVDDLEETLEQLNEASANLKIVDNDIKKLVKENQLDVELQSAEEYREKITTWRFRANKKIKDLNKNTEVPDGSVKNETNCSKKETISVKLPKLQIFHYSGSNDEFLSFWSAYESAIHKNKNLDPVDKFNYLRSYLTGTALRSIQGYAVTAENYNKAIETITQRFGQKEILINAHMSNLLNLTPLKSSSDVKGLRKIYDDIQINIRSLESLDVSLSTYSTLLSPILLKILGKDLLIEFHKDFVNRSYDVQDIIDFMYKHLLSRERLCEIENDKSFSHHTSRHARQIDATDQNRHYGANTSFQSHRNKINYHEKKNVSTAFDLVNQNKTEKEICSFCQSEFHESNFCTYAASLPFQDRVNLLRKLGLCYRCLKGKHIARTCVKKVNCTRCNNNHATIMCKENNGTMPINENTKGNGLKNHTLSNQINSSKVYLQTLIVGVKGNGTSCFLRVLIDTASQNTYVTKYAAEKLKLRKIKTEKITHSLFGGIQKTENHTRYQLTLSSLDKRFSCKIEALDQNKICSGINSVNDFNLIKTLEDNNIFLSDTHNRENLCIFEENSEEIHLLLGADMASGLFTENIKYFPDLGLTAFGLKLGWAIMGQKNECSDRTENSMSVLSLSLHVSNMKLTELWRLDVLGISAEENKNKAMLEEETQKHFLKTVKRDETGRYEVSLPWIADQSTLPNNRALAIKSLNNTDIKLVKSDNKKEYTDIFNFWESSQIIEEIKDEKSENVHFLPHKPVLKETSATTRLRPVFNASSHTKGSPSLNDCLTKGPNLIEIIPSILNRFRKYRIGISSDIEKAFLQIKITEKDRDFLRFFWFNEDGSLKTFRHCRVVFGLSSSPYLLMATLQHLLSQVPTHLVETAKILKDSFYIDNSLTSLEFEHDTSKFVQESKEILASGQFNLRCWRSNLKRVMDAEDENQVKHTPVLGLIWDLEIDRLFCKIDEGIKVKEPYTKRKILSITQKIFDPIGYTSPVTLVPKLILQETWIQKLGWDEELPENLKKRFFAWMKKISVLPDIKIPRWLNIDSAGLRETSLHVFADASGNAYAACVYTRTETMEGVKVQLVNARSRVAPIKELTIPRLELLACLIASRLASTIKCDLQIEEMRTFFWSDSTTALGWIRRDINWGTFVQNRVSEIRSLTKIEDWRHVPGNLNPADLPSRGCSFEQLEASKWWEGPPWLYLPEEQWPQSEERPDDDQINREKRKTVLTLIDKHEEPRWYYRHFSSYKKIVRMLAWMYRFLHNSKNPQEKLSHDISIEEFERAEKTLLKLIQKEAFSDRNDATLRALKPTEDEFGLLRARTSLLQRQDLENFRYPIILPSNHPVVKKLIFGKHVERYHAGVNTLMTELRENYWILKSRKAIRNVIRKCQRCKRFATQKIEVEPGVLPEDRVKEAAVFEVVGIDLAGPLFLSDGSKAWVVLYTCAVYRAVHLELVTSLSTQSFLQALRRFVARRGRPYIIYTDNGRNFIGADRALTDLDWSAIEKETSAQKIRWKFNPPAAPWWGGWWERLIRMMKEILRKILGRASLNLEELQTILCDCEEIINSRPITYVSEDNKDPSPLTPKMFLQELPTSGVPDIDTTDRQSLNRRIRYRQRLRQDLRNRFRSEYLGQLRQYAIRKENSYQLKIGDIVLLEDSNRKRIHWPLARVIEIIPGKDNITRLARVKTENGTLLRAVQRLYPMEVRSPNGEQTSDNSATETQDKCTPPVVTRKGRTIRPPQRLQLTS